MATYDLRKKQIASTGQRTINMHQTNTVEHRLQNLESKMDKILKALENKNQEK